MTDFQKYALEITERIVVSQVSSSTLTPSQASGEHVGKMFESIYRTVYSLVSAEESK